MNWKIIIGIIFVAILIFSTVRDYKTHKEYQKQIDNANKLTDDYYLKYKMTLIDVTQCRDYLNISSESLWDCQDKLAKCKGEK